jgi:hypothetical protein
MDLNDRWFKVMNRGGAISFVGGLLLFGLSEDIPWRKALGIAAAGLGLAILFLPGAIDGRFVFDPERDTTDSKLGMAIRLWSVVMIAGGLSVFIFGLVQMVSPQSAARFSGSHNGLGVILVLGGSALSFYYLVRLLGLQAREATLQARLAELPGRLYSIAGILVGLLVITAGLVQILAPDLPGQLVRELLPPLPTPPA